MKKIVIASAAALAALASTAALTLPARTLELAPEQRASVDDFALGASMAIMLHEVGHLLVNELDIPILGREEDVADTISTLTLLMQEDEDEERALEFLDASIINSFLFGEGEYGPLDDARMADEHALSRQRAFAAVCLAYGSGHPHFRDYAERHGLPEYRMETCEMEFPKALSSFARLLEPHLLAENAGQVGQPIITYEETATYAHIAELLKAEGFLEEIADLVFSAVAMPRDVLFAAQECDMVNAYYTPMVDWDHPDLPAVVFCYEMADHVGTIYAEAFFGESAVDTNLPFTRLADAVEDGLGTSPEDASRP